MAVIIDGSTGITGVNGSAAAPSVTGTDTDTGIVYGTNTLSLATGGTTAVTVDSSQNVGFGNTSPAARVDAFRSTVGTYFLGGGGDNVARQLAIKSSTTANSGDTHTFDAQSGTGVIAFATTGTERVRIDTVGTLGIGVTPNTWNVPCVIQGNYGAITLNTNLGNTVAANAYYNGGWKYRLASTARLYSQDSTAHIWSRAVSGSVDGTISWLEDMRIDANGSLLVGTSSVNFANSGFTLSSNAGTTKWLCGPYTPGPTSFYVTAQSGYGVILASTTSTSWSSNSDERLKTNLNPIENAAQKVCSLRAVTGRYKIDDEGVSRSFLIAQDVQAVLPEAVSSAKIVGSTEDTEYLSVAYTDVIPLLVAALKEQQAIIETLKARLDAANL